MTGAVTSQVRPGGAQAWLVWVLATTFVVWLFAIQTGYAVVSPEIQATANLSIAQVGLAASVYTWVFAVAQFFSGALLDRFGTRPLLAIAVALVTIGAFLYAASTTFATLAVAQFVLAMGASFGFVGAGYVGGTWFPAARYGLMFGLVQAFASLGSAVGQPVILGALSVLDWQQLLLAFATFGVLLTILFVLFVRDAAPRDHASSDRHVLTDILTDLGRCFTNLRVVLAALIAGASFGTMLAVGTLWGPRLLQARGLDPEFSTVLTAVSWLGLAVGAPMVNIVSNRWHSRKRPALVALILQGVCIFLVIYLPTTGDGAAVGLMFAIGLFSGVQMLGFTIAGEAVTVGLIGSASAVVNGVCFLVGGLLVSIPSALLPSSPDLAAYQAVLWTMPAAVAVGVVAAAVLRDPVHSRTSQSKGEPAHA